MLVGVCSIARDDNSGVVVDLVEKRVSVLTSASVSLIPRQGHRPSTGDPVTTVPQRIVGGTGHRTGKCRILAPDPQRMTDIMAKIIFRS